MLGRDGGVLVGLEGRETLEQAEVSTDTPSFSRRRAPAWSMRSIALSGSTRSDR